MKFTNNDLEKIVDLHKALIQIVTSTDEAPSIRIKAAEQALAIRRLVVDFNRYCM